MAYASAGKSGRLCYCLVGLDWKKYVERDPIYYRPAEVDLPLGNPAKAKEKLGWKPKTTFKELVKIMLEYDLNNCGLSLDKINKV